MSFMGGWNLQRKAAMAIAVVLILVIGLSTAMIGLTLIPQLRDSLLTSSTLIGQNLIKDIRASVDLGVPIEELDGVDVKMNEIVALYPDLGYIFIASPGGKILFRSSAGPAEAPPELAGTGHDEADGAAEGTGHTTRLRFDGQEYYDTALHVESSGKLAGVVHVGLKAQVVGSRVNAVLSRALLIGLVSFLAAAVLITLFVNRFISRPLEELAESARGIAAGNLRPLPPTRRKDEIGQLSEAFRMMVERLAAIITHTGKTAENLERSSGNLARAAGELADAFRRQTASLEDVAGSITEMDRLTHSLSEQSRNLSSSAVESSTSIMETTAAIGEINRRMSEITASVDNISSSIMEMSTTVREVAAGAESSAGLAEETRKAIGRINDGIRNIGGLAEQSQELAGTLRTNASEVGAASMRETLNGIRSIQEDVRHAESAMQSLQQRVEDIGQIVGVIGDIADQTNLLALNASIISAQAGEQGRAFAVVASEIRDLSVRTSDSTKKISSLVSGVQAESDNYSSHLNRVISSVVRGLELGHETESALETIVASTDEAARMSGVITQVTHDQGEASRKVSDSVEIFTRSAEEIRTATREEAKAAEFITDSMERTRHMVQMVYRATDEQNKGSKLIAETSEKAKEVASDLTMATETQRQLSTTLAKAMEALRTITTDTSSIVAGLNVSSRDMAELSASLRSELGRFQLHEAPPADEAAKPVA